MSGAAAHGGCAQVMAGARHGGAELFFERLCVALHEAGDTVLPVIRRDAGRCARLASAGLAPRELRFGGWHDLLTRVRLRGLLRRAAPSVVVAWMGRAAAAIPRGGWTLVGRLGGYYDLRRFARCQHLVGNTEDIVDWIVRQGWPARRVHHLPNFVPDFSGVAAADPGALGVPAGRRFVLGLGRLHAAKGFDTLIRALPGLPLLHAVIAGEGPERAALLRLAQAQGVAERVHLLGWRADTGALLAACDAYVCASRHEPLGNTVLEAWSAGVPVVAAAAAGPAALIRHGADGVLVPIDDAAGLRLGIQGVLESRARGEAIGQAGRARWVAEYTPAGVTARWRGFMASVAG